MSIIIRDIQRNSSEIIRIEVSEFKGRELINIRIWYQTIDSRSGDVVYKPTQKGVTLNITEFEHLKDGIDKLAVYIKDSQAGTTPEQPTNPPPTTEGENEDDDENKDDEKQEGAEE